MFNFDSAAQGGTPVLVIASLMALAGGSYLLALLAVRIAHAYALALSEGAPAMWRTLLSAVLQALNAEWRYKMPVGTLVLFALTLFAGVVLVLAASGHGSLWRAPDGLFWGMAALHIAFFYVLGVLALIDVRTGLLPNALSYPLAAFGLVLAYSGIIVRLPEALVAAAVIVLLLACVRAFMLRRGVEGVGLGDIKVLMAVGLWLGVQGAFTVMLFANVLLLIWAGMRRMAGGPQQHNFAFGPFIWLGVLMHFAVKLL